MINVIVESTGVEMMVTEEYYEKYGREGLIKVQVKELTYNEKLKARCDEEGIDYKGNASNKALLKLLGE